MYVFLFQDPSMMAEMMKGNVTNVLPTIVIGGWITWAFSGFLTSLSNFLTNVVSPNNQLLIFTAKVPFPLTLRFKPMLQRGVELASLDASWLV